MTRATLANIHSLVVKIGSQTLSDTHKRLDQEYLRTIASQIATLRRRKIAVTLVSSGAIAAGMGELKFTKRPTDLSQLQAVAAVGQRKLMDAWADAFEPHGLHVAQVLLTREDIDSRKRFLNLRNTIHALHELGAVPIINENDTISTDEIVRISFGDNDILAAHVSAALRADVLVLLSNVDGVLNAAGQTVPTIPTLGTVRALVRSEKSNLGKGGMDSKIDAATMVTQAGEMLIVAHGRMPDVLIRLIDGEEVGTIFLPQKASRTKGPARWIRAARPVGTIVVDDGAAKAIVERDVSLLPAGITRISGDFEKGDVVAIANSVGHTLAHGLTNYASSDLDAIKGKKSGEVRSILKDRTYDEVVHRDNLVKLLTSTQ